MLVLSTTAVQMEVPVPEITDTSYIIVKKSKAIPVTGLGGIGL
jgi:hypothetical protein